MNTRIEAVVASLRQQLLTAEEDARRNGDKETADWAKRQVEELDRPGRFETKERKP